MLLCCGHVCGVWECQGLPCSSVVAPLHAVFWHLRWAVFVWLRRQPYRCLPLWCVVCLLVLLLVFMLVMHATMLLQLLLPAPLHPCPLIWSSRSPPSAQQAHSVRGS